MTDYRLDKPSNAAVEIVYVTSKDYPDALPEYIEVECRAFGAEKTHRIDLPTDRRYFASIVENTETEVVVRVLPF